MQRREFIAGLGTVAAWPLAARAAAGRTGAAHWPPRDPVTSVARPSDGETAGYLSTSKEGPP
jgi:hypothetical protein